MSVFIEPEVKAQESGVSINEQQVKLIQPIVPNALPKGGKNLKIKSGVLSKPISKERVEISKTTHTKPRKVKPLGKLSFPVNELAGTVDVQLPPIEAHKPNVRKHHKRNESLLPKRRILSPLSNKTMDSTLARPDSAMRYDSEKFLLYSVFRQSILDEVLRELTRDVVKQTITGLNKKPNQLRRKNKSIVSGAKINKFTRNSFKYDPSKNHEFGATQKLGKDFEIIFDGFLLPHHSPVPTFPAQILTLHKLARHSDNGTKL